MEGTSGASFPPHCTPPRPGAQRCLHPSESLSPRRCEDEDDEDGVKSGQWCTEEQKRGRGQKRLRLESKKERSSPTHHPEKRPAGVSRRGVTDTVAAGLRHRGARGRHKRTAKSHQSESVLRRGEGLEHPDLEKSQSELKLELQSDGQSDLCPALIGGRDPDSPPPAALRSFFQSLRSKVASFTEIVMSPVRLLKHSEALLGGPQGTPGPRARIRLQLDGLPAPGPAPSPPPALCTPATPESVGEQVFRTPPEGPPAAQEGADTSPVGGAGEEGRGAGRSAPPGAPPAPQESVEGEGQHKEGGAEGRGRRSEGGAEGEGQHKEGGPEGRGRRPESGPEGRGRRSEGGAEGRGRRPEGGAEGRTPTRASGRRASWGVSETKREVPTAGAGRRAASLSPGGALWGSLALKAAVVRISRQPLPAPWGAGGGLPGARSGRGPPAVRRPPPRGLRSAPGPSRSGSPAPKRGRGALRLPGAPETAPLLRRAVVQLGCRVRLPPGGGGTAPPSSAGRRGRPPGRRRRRGGAAGPPPADPPGRPPRAPRLLRSFSCPEIRAPPGPPAPSWPAPPPRPSPARRPRRHTVCSLELAREIAPLCLRKEVHPRPCCAPPRQACPSSCCSPSSPSSSSLSARATCFLSSPLAFLSRRHGDQERGGARGDLTSCSSPAPAFLVPGSSACVPAGPSCSPETPSCYRQGPAEQAGGERSGVVTLQEDGGDFSLELEVTETRDERLLSDSVIKGDCLQPGTRGMVSRFRIRKTLPKPPANLTPMGLPRPVRLKKKQFSLEEIYTNKNFRLPPEGRLETIFEVPVSGRDGALSLIGPRRLRRALDFPEAGVARKPRRLLGSCRRAGAARTRRAGRSPLSPSLLELDSLLSAKLDQLEAWIALEESGAPSDP